MIEHTLEEQILHFVSTFRVVKEAQIYRFFRDWDNERVKHIVQELKIDGVLIAHENGRISTVRFLHAPLSAFDSCIDALVGMLELPSREVTWMFAQNYPVDLCFGTVSNNVYDVTFFGTNWQVKYGLIPTARKAALPTGEKDIVKHIAVVRDESLLEKIAPLGFDLFIVIEPDGLISKYDPPEDE